MGDYSAVVERKDGKSVKQLAHEWIETHYGQIIHLVFRGSSVYFIREDKPMQSYMVVKLSVKWPSGENFGKYFRIQYVETFMHDRFGQVPKILLEKAGIIVNENADKRWVSDE